MYEREKPYDCIPNEVTLVGGDAGSLDLPSFSLSLGPLVNLTVPKQTDQTYYQVTQVLPVEKDPRGPRSLRVLPHSQVRLRIATGMRLSCM